MRVVSPFVGALDGTFFRMGVLPFCVAYVWVLYMVCMSYERFFVLGVVLCGGVHALWAFGSSFWFVLW